MRSFDFMVRKKEKRRVRAIPKHDKDTAIKEFHSLYFDKNQKNRAFEKIKSLTPTYIYRYRPAHKFSADSLTYEEIQSITENRDSINPEELVHILEKKKQNQKGGFDELISMIQNHEFSIWFTNPHKFNDPYDSFISYDISGLFLEYQDIIDYSPVLLENFVQNLKEIPCPESKDEQNRIIFSAVKKALFNPRTNIPPLLSDDEVERVKEYSSYHLQNYLSKSNYSFSNSLSENMGVACFSEENKNILMWSHYAENHTGYCLEYRTRDIQKAFNDMTYGLFPVKYTVEFETWNRHFARYVAKVLESQNIAPLIDSIWNKVNSWGENMEIEDIMSWLFSTETVELINNIIPTSQKRLLDDEFMIRHYLKRSSQKSKDWKYEKEWRVIKKLPSDANQDERCLSVVPTCIYLGAKTADEDVERVVKAIDASGLKIPVKRMCMNLDYMQLYEIECFKPPTKNYGE